MICAAITAARAALAAGTVLDEAASLDLLREADIAVARFKRVESLPASIEAAADLGYPVVLKTGRGKPVAPAGVELAFGCIDDPVYGPLVSIGAGGSLVELLHETCLLSRAFWGRHRETFDCRGYVLADLQDRLGPSVIVAEIVHLPIP